MTEERAFTEFETRYRSEFENIYKFLIAFYDFNRHENSCFWEARKILDTPERDNEAFVRLVSGVSTVDMEVFSTGQRISDHLRSFDEGRDEQGILKTNQLVRLDMRGLQDHVLHGHARPAEKPRHEGGLVPTADGFFWAAP